MVYELNLFYTSFEEHIRTCNFISIFLSPIVIEQKGESRVIKALPLTTNEAKRSKAMSTDQPTFVSSSQSCTTLISLVNKGFKPIPLRKSYAA